MDQAIDILSHFYGAAAKATVPLAGQLRGGQAPITAQLDLRRNLNLSSNSGIRPLQEETRLEQTSPLAMLSWSGRLGSGGQRPRGESLASNKRDPERAEVLAQQSPDDEAPDAGFDGAYTGSQSASTGIMGMLEVRPATSAKWRCSC